MQMKLTKEQIGKLKQARNGIFNGFIYSDTDEGGGYWREVTDKLDAKIHHGTSDGKPLVEPEPPIPEGWRKANADEYKRRDVKCWSYRAGEWEMRLIQGSKFDPPGGRSIYIVPIDPPLTDEDACVIPRLLVMVRDYSDRDWIGPFQYFGKGDDHAYPFVINGMGKVGNLWKHARRATREEIEAANGNS